MSSVISDQDAKHVVAYNVTHLLDARGWSQNQLAVKTGENRMNISRICRGENMPGAGILARIAEALEVSVDDLFRAIPKKTRK